MGRRFELVKCEECGKSWWIDVDEYLQGRYYCQKCGCKKVYSLGLKTYDLKRKDV